MEILVAVVILALGMMILMGLFSRLVRHQYEARHYQQAAWLLDELLEKKLDAERPLAEGAGAIEGDFGSEREREIFRYRMEIQPTSDPALKKVTAWVFWMESDHEKQICATTLVYSEPIASQPMSP
ncbi:MAG: hypothetical protein JW709_14340 [Sedimentisphaerales bacterium]|nr:hypothetical protein [Sedimentisphaerales bacterium]